MMRLFELAKELSLTTPELVHVARINGLQYRTASRRLNANEVAELRRLVEAKRAERPLFRPPSPVPGSEEAEPVDGFGHCGCCGRNRVQLYSRYLGHGEYRLATHCLDCHDHRGNLSSDIERRRDDHLQLWRAEHDLAVHGATERAAQDAERIAKLQLQLAERPVREVERWVGRDRIEDADERRDSAYRSRDRAFLALCEVRLLHRDDGAGACRCGKRFDRCETAAIVARYPALDGWEATQVRRRRERLDYLLPDGHPALIDSRWRPDEGSDDTAELEWSRRGD